MNPDASPGHDAKTQSPKEIEEISKLLNQEYVALRSEICQSISYQHQILLAGYAGVGGILAYIVSKGQPLSPTIVAILPFPLLAMAALWVVECNRMVRASYYIGHRLWKELRSLTNYRGAASWETWIRRKSGRAADFGERQCVFQWLVVFVFPVAVFIASTAILLPAIVKMSCERVFASFVIFLGTAICWVIIGTALWRISNLANTPDEEDRNACST